MGTCGCQRHLRCPGGAQRTCEGIYLPGVASAKLGVKLPRKSMWCERQRSKFKSPGDLRERGLARRLAADRLCPGPALMRRGWGFFPSCRSHPCPSLYPLLLSHAQRALSQLAPTVLGLRSVSSFHQESRRTRWGCRAGGRRDLTLETFFLKHSKKQMALQSTEIPLGWKFKMH